MHTEKREDPLVELGYEVRDLNTVAIRNAAIGFFVFAALSAAVGFFCYRVMNPAVFGPAPRDRSVIPPQPYPMVQTNTESKVDIMDLRQHETAVLTAPIGWADPQKTYLHVPIDRAMNIIANHGGSLEGVRAGGPRVMAPSKPIVPDLSGIRRAAAASSASKTSAGGSPHVALPVRAPVNTQ